MVLNAPASNLETIVASILFSGAIFVIMVVRLSLASIRLSEHFAARERHRALRAVLALAGVAYLYLNHRRKRRVHT